MALLLLRLIASYIIKFFGEEYPSRVDGLTIAPICQGLGSLPEGGKGKSGGLSGLSHRNLGGKQPLGLAFVQKTAEDLYFRSLAAVAQQLPVRRADGGFIRLIGCFLYEVPTLDLTSAKRIVRLNEARRLQGSDDCMCGVPFDIDLFRVIN